MTESLNDRIKDLCLKTILPLVSMPLSLCAKIKDISINDHTLSISISFKIPYQTQLPALKKNLLDALQSLLSKEGLAINTINLHFESRIESYKNVNTQSAIPQVKNLIAIASGKGGVGKSTTTINLALALQQEGARVGILDADIFGPSQSILTGVPDDTRPDVKDEKYFLPVQAYNLQIMSMGFLVDENTPMVWRGPKASGALQQLLKQTLWDNLDYLLVDMPPGTGDIQLTLSQSCPLTAAVIVTTPQDVALLDAIKGIEMFRKVDVPILGIIENMSTHLCSHCGHTEAIFGEGGGERIATNYHSKLLGSLPLDINIRQHADQGKPSVVADPNGEIANTYRKIALHVATELAQLSVNSVIPNVVSI